MASAEHPAATRPVYFWDGLPYPLTIFRTRYGGTYEGGSWAALTADQVPEDAIADDVTCWSYWFKVALGGGVIEDDGFPIAFGIGATAVEAVNVCVETAKQHNKKVEARDDDA